MPRYSDQYIANLLKERNNSALVALQGIALGSDLYNREVPLYGLPSPISTVYEIATWVAQADRSGAWTYYEGVPTSRVDAVGETLISLNAAELHRRYVNGAKAWQDDAAMETLEEWIRASEPRIIEWAFTVLANHPTELARVCE